MSSACTLRSCARRASKTKILTEIVVRFVKITVLLRSHQISLNGFSVCRPKDRFAAVFPDLT